METFRRKMQGAWRTTTGGFLFVAVVSCSSTSSNSSNPSGAPNDGAAAACNTLIDDGPQVTATAIAGTAPAPAGGTIADGTYALSAVTLHTGPGGAMSAPSGTFTAVLQIKGATMLQVGTVNGQETRYLSTFSTSGTMISETDTCPAPKTETHAFSATASELRIYDAAGAGTLEQAYTKR